MAAYFLEYGHLILKKKACITAIKIQAHLVSYYTYQETINLCHKMTNLILNL
jgi:hypothetical protein